MKSSREWLEEHTLDLDEVWERLTKSDDQKLLADPNAPKPKKKDNPILAAVRDYMEEAPHKSIDEGADKSGRPLTKAERLEAVRSVVNKATNILQDEIQRNSLGILPDEDLDGLAAVLRTQSDSIRKMLAARGAKI